MLIRSTTKTINLEYDSELKVSKNISIDHNVDKIIVKNLSVTNDITDTSIFKPIFSIKSLIIKEQYLFSFLSKIESIISPINHEFYINTTQINSLYDFYLTYDNESPLVDLNDLDCTVTFSLEFQQLKP